jgi:exopolyphosphatase/guanosine-5'-triphosphate,3'-diphosphate pyrophosphatase
MRVRAAVIGIGSNSIRLLVADIQGGKMKEVLRDREGTRLFGGLDSQGNLSQESMAKTLATIVTMQEKAVQLHADALDLFATSAVRDAGNQQEFSSLIQERSGLALEILPGESEAALSFFGATSGLRCGVIDIGGGSTEYVIGKGASIECGVSLQMGAVRLFRMYPVSSSQDLPNLLRAAADTLGEGIGPLLEKGLPDSWVGVGGTLTAMAAVSKGLPWTEKTRLNGYVLTREEVGEWLVRLSDMPLMQRLSLPGLQPHRADIMVHGTAILKASMDKLNIAQITVSEFGNLDGYLKQKYLLNPSVQA